VKAHQSKPQHGHSQLSDETKFKVVSGLLIVIAYYASRQYSTCNKAHSTNQQGHKSSNGYATEKKHLNRCFSV